jgi:hypothetical protein
MRSATGAGKIGASSRATAGLFVPALIVVCLITPSQLAAADIPIRFAGILSGLVTDSGGRPQAGAMVMLFNKQDRLLQRSATDLGGTFSFDELIPDLYSVRVTFASFVPALKDRVVVKPGMRSLLEVSLSRVFSSVQLVSTVPAAGGLMSEDWKWTLRSDAALRPILRFMPAAAVGHPALDSEADKSSMFTESHGLVRISASDGAQTVSDTGEADLGTQFAFATSLHGGNHVQVSGNVGYGSASGAPAASFRTTYSRDFLGTSPAVSVTMRQLFVPFRTGQTGTLTGAPSYDSAPALRTLALSYADKSEISDVLSAEYGFELDMISFVDRLHYFSPFARLNYAVGNGKVDFTWTSGNSRPELGVTSDDPNADLRRDLAALSVVPRVTLENGATRVQRGDDYEIGLTQKFGSREYRIAAYNERVSNTSLMIANPEAVPFAGELMPDLFSNSALFNAGVFENTGYMASVTQNLGDNYRVSATWGSLGVIEAHPNGLIESADDLLRAIGAGNRQAVTVRASGTVHQTRTRFVTSYQWANYRSAMPGPQYSTGSSRPEPGFNVMLKQPIPSLFGWHVEASAEVRNLLAQGYLPLMMADGQQLLLVNTPRTFRGGLAFVF